MPIVRPEVIEPVYNTILNIAKENRDAKITTSILASIIGGDAKYTAGSALKLLEKRGLIEDTTPSKVIRKEYKYKKRIPKDDAIVTGKVEVGYTKNTCTRKPNKPKPNKPICKLYTVTLETTHDELLSLVNNNKIIIKNFGEIDYGNK